MISWGIILWYFIWNANIFRWMIWPENIKTCQYHWTVQMNPPLKTQLVIFSSSIYWISSEIVILEQWCLALAILDSNGNITVKLTSNH